MHQIILLSDTHNTLDQRFFTHFKNADEIWHAGDIGNITVTEKLKKFAPLRAVWGNIDDRKIRLHFEETLYFKCEEVSILMTHIGGYPNNYNKKILAILKEKNQIYLLVATHIF